MTQSRISFLSIGSAIKNSIARPTVIITAILLPISSLLSSPPAAASSSPSMVQDINPGSADSGPAFGVNIAGTTYFVANDGTHGGELWKSDGTSAGTVMVKDINPGAASSNASELVNLNGTLLFGADDGTDGYELWKSDGTSAGTVMVKDINPGSGESDPDLRDNGVVVGSTAYFVASDGTNGFEVWKTDGTSAGTVMVKDINTGSGDSNPEQMTNVNGTVYFMAYDNSDGLNDPYSGGPYALWKTDGTTVGTVKVKDINLFGGDGLINGNGTLLFSANDGTHGYELWTSDGTTAGTVMVKDITAGGTGSNPNSFTNMGGATYFFAGTSSPQLWKTDGTATGTAQVNSANFTRVGDGGTRIVYAGGDIFFVADNGNGHGDELWKSDGTNAGTSEVSDINPGSSSSTPTGLTNVDGTLFFSANDGAHGQELWQTDGTTAGTAMVADINTGSGDSDPGAFATPSHKEGAFLTTDTSMYFTASDGTHGVELWGLALPTIAAPTGLSATSPTQAPVLGWSSVSGADHYKIYRDGTSIGTSSVTSYTDSSSMADGYHTYAVSAVDILGNESFESSRLNVLVDKTAPSVSASLSPAANGAGWNKANVTVNFTCSDATSGIASCSSPVTVSTETSGQTVTGTATDNVGNTASVSVTVKLDKTNPTASSLTLTPSSIHGSGSTMSLSASASDARSGVVGGEYYIDTDPGQGNGTAMASSSGTITATATIGGLSNGQHTMFVRSKDAAGNWSSTTSTNFIFHN